MGRRDPPGLKDTAAERRSFVTLPLAQLVPPLTRTAFRARSPAGADLMANWDSIVGPRLAALTVPRKLSRGQLTIACSGPVAMELQHAAAAVIERINVHAGSGIVQRLRFVQAQITTAPPVRVASPQGATAALENFPAGALNEALASLRARIGRK